MSRVNGLNGTTSGPKSVPRLVQDKVRLVPVFQTLPYFERSPIKVNHMSSTMFSRYLFCAQACIIDILFIEWMLPLWISFETNIHCYFSMKY